MEEQSVKIRGISSDVLAIIDAHAKERKLSRNNLLKLVIETFAENVESKNAANVLAIPLQEFTSQLNLLTKALNENTAVMSEHLENVDSQLNNLVGDQDTVLTKINQTLNEVTVVKGQLRNRY